jgi:hypothetical protein
MAEDPANRRLNGGTAFSFLIHVIPMALAQVIQTVNGPAMVHSNDFSLVSSAKPASAGEVLSLFATGLGPTVPEVDLGLPFPSSPLSTVNSPLTVTVNGKPARVLAAAAIPAQRMATKSVFRYLPTWQKVPPQIHLTAAWIPGPTVNIPIQLTMSGKERES